MSSMEELDKILLHYGVKGMHWGVRRRRSSGGGSEDAQRAAAAQHKVKKAGTKALSNKELQDLVTRMNLEQQYKKLSPPSGSARAKKFVAEILLNVGKQQASRIASDIASEQIGKALKKK